MMPSEHVSPMPTRQPSPWHALRARRWSRLLAAGLSVVLLGYGDLAQGAKKGPLFTPIIVYADVEVLSKVKTLPTDPVLVGNTLTYEVTVKNLGPAEATGVTVTDQLPAAVTFAGASAGCIESAGTVTCTLATPLAVNASTVFTIDATADAPALLVNTANVTANEVDEDLANNSAQDITIVQSDLSPDADLAVTISDDADPIEDTITSIQYTTTVTNNGSDVATGVTLVFTLPAEIMFGTPALTAGPSAMCGMTKQMYPGSDLRRQCERLLPLPFTPACAFWRGPPLPREEEPKNRLS